MSIYNKHSLLFKPIIGLRWLFAALLIICTIALFFLHQYHLREEHDFFIERASSMLHEELKNKYDVGRAVSLSFTNDTRVRESMPFEDRDAIIKELKSAMQLYAKSNRFNDVEMHIITADGRSLAKSFNLDSYNQDLSDHSVIGRSLESSREAVGIEIGGPSEFYRIIVSTPIYAMDDPNEIVGFAANSQSFESTVVTFRERDWAFAVFRATHDETTGQESFTVKSKTLYPNAQINRIKFTAEELESANHHNKDGLLLFTHNVYAKDGTLLASLAVAQSDQFINEHAWGFTWEFIYFSILGFLLTWFISYYMVSLVRNNVITPIQRLDNTFDEIIQSKAFDQKLEIKGEDEIGRLSQKFNSLLDVINESLYSLKLLQSGIEQTLIVSRTDPFGTITYVNDNFCKISGYDRETLIGKSHNIVRHPEMPSNVYKELWQTIQNKQIWSGQIKNRAKNGETYYVTSYILPIMDKSGNVKEYMSIREDITETVNLQESLQHALEDAESKKMIAEKSNQAKSEFLSSMSHELRTPLNSIIGFAQLLEMSNLSKDQQEQLHNISHSGQHLLKLINDLLELSKIEAGSTSFSIEPVHIEAIINESIQLIRPLATKANIGLTIDQNSPLNYKILVDHLRLKQVLMNFLSNAVKYNSVNGNITVHTSVSTDENKMPRIVRISVTDTGPGIPKNKQKHLFEPFHRLGHENSNIEGTGIGLTITKELVETMGGIIGVDSVEREGSTFWVEFKVDSELDENEQHQEESIQHTTIESSFIKQSSDEKVILYIEDNPANMKLMMKLVESVPNTTLIISPTAEDGISKAKAVVPDILFIDINLPGMNGNEALPILKQIPELQEKGSKFYALTANAMRDDVNNELNKGFDAYLTKPINVKEIIDIIQA